ncbi:hypothetical protein [Cellulomonas sp. C5510]|uniref:hypothetical protein n=1 Tax=Cellulomonas sp. C5510 TaxID=2871170 RepID=UPI0021071173|nr:hypothetical protein [Cellulomonas sp. C5510]
MAEPLVVQLRPETRQALERRATRDPVLRGTAAMRLALFVSALLLVPLIAVNAIEGFRPRTLVLLLFLAVPAAIALWGRRMLRTVPSEVAVDVLVISDDDVRFEALTAVNPAMGVAEPDVWPRVDTTSVRSACGPRTPGWAG